MKPTTIDFETKGIDARPQYPPEPVGVSIKYFGKKSKYYSFGHVNGKNNCTKAEARIALADAYKTKDGILMQNTKFDIDVAEIHMGMPRLDWSKYHDTMFLLFLDDPHQDTFSLKPAAERLLDWPPDEQEAVRDWLLSNQPIADVKISNSIKSDHYWGRYICLAPAELVGKYAAGDTDRTEALFKLLYKRICDNDMLEAYNRERELMPILLDNERRGLPIDVDRLESDILTYEGFAVKIDAWLTKKLGDINFSSGMQLTQALIDKGFCDETKLQYTDKGNVKSDKTAIAEICNNAQLVAVLKYRTQLLTCLNTFMQPWYRIASTNKGIIHTWWNQIKGSERGNLEGAKTGRLSSRPSLMNIPKKFDPIFADEEKGLPKCPIKNLPRLPQVRSYIIPFPGHVLLDRDYSQQELRILAHFEDGVLKEAYEKNVWMDVHDYATTLINGLTGKSFTRKPIKNTGFGLLYGMGIAKLAVKSDIPVEVAKEVKKAYLQIFPGLKALYDDMKARYRNGNIPIRTWGGRIYYCEEPQVINGILRHFDYRMVNKLIQGSAADCTKEAIIRYHRAKPKGHIFMLTVHDEILVSVPKREYKKGMDTLKTTIESVEFEIPILSEGKIGSKFNDMTQYDKQGVICYDK